MKKIDPGLEHIREIRHTISQEHGHDAKRLTEHYRKIEEQYRDRLLKAVETRESESGLSTA